MANMSSEKYSVEVNNVKKEARVSVKGTFSPEDARKFIEEYQRKMNSIQAHEYILTVHCTDLDLVRQEMQDNLQACFELYKNTGFKKVVFEVNSVIYKMQFSRLSRNVGLNNVEFIGI